MFCNDHVAAKRCLVRLSKYCVVLGMQSVIIINALQTFLISHNTFALIIMKKPIP